MTVGIGIIVNPKGKRKPYFLIGADSKKKDIIDIEDGVPRYVYSDDFMKIYEVKNIVYMSAGAVPGEFFEVIQSYMNTNQKQFHEMCRELLEFVYEYFEEQLKVIPFEYMRVRMVLCTIIEDVPEMALIEVDTRNPIVKRVDFFKQDKKGFHVEFIGNTKKTTDLQDEFIKNMGKKKNITFYDVKNDADKYLKAAAKRYPDTCNENTNFKPKKL